MAANYGPCTVVGKGRVGEAGSSAQVTHTVTAKIEKLMLLKNVETSLCPDHGAAAVLLVDGAVAASGVITAVGSSIQATAKPGQNVVGVVATFPLMNGVNCIRLGNLDFTLSECDLVG